MDRRTFLKSSSITLIAGSTSKPLFASTPKKKIIVIQLQGGADGLSLVIPHSDNSLFDMRKDLITDESIEIDSDFALHSSLKNFSTLMSKGQAAVIHATNFPYTKRSHFEGQNVMQGGGKPFEYDTGWLGRAMGLSNNNLTTLSLDIPLLVRGAINVTNYMPSLIESFQLERNSEFLEQLGKLHAGPIQSNLKELRHKYLEKEGSVNTTVHLKGRTSSELASYAGNEMSYENGPDAAIITIPGYDTHSNQLQQMKTLSQEVDLVIEQFRQGLGPKWHDTIVLTLTEFGRTVKSNSAHGTEHGYGTAALLAGGLVTNPSVIADWPGLKKLHDDRDLKATIDYRSICAACIEVVFGLDHDEIAEKVFFDKQLPNLKKYVFA